jgi:hypothetical protein
MNEPHVSLGPSSLDPVERKLRTPLEEQLSSALQAATERVTDSYAGEPVDEVRRRLEEETRAGLHPDIADAFEPNEAELRRVAEVIVERASAQSQPEPG